MRPETVEEIDDDTADEVRDIAAQAALVDGVAPLSEQTLLALRPSSGHAAAVQHVLLREGPDLVGYAHIDEGTSAELVVAPTVRDRGFGRLLLDTVLELAPAVHIWSHGHLTAAQTLAEAAGLVVVRELRQLGRAASPGPPPHDIELPDGFTMRTFTSADEQAWLDVNAAAFAHHPEQGQVTLADLRDREAEPWFDPAGFFLLFDERGEGQPELAAFHWTKIEPPTGEVYVVGVRPGLQGLGLGRAATRVGLAHLDRLVERITLYVDGDNDAAVATYRREGFEQLALDVQLARPA